MENAVTEQNKEANLPQHLQKLNPPQLEATTHVNGPILVLAGAGSGKTRILTRRVVSLILDRGVKPRNIFAVTFTNKATEEMRERLRHLLGDQARELWVATFHSAALKILRHHARLLQYTNDFAIYDEQDSKNVLKGVLKELAIDDKKFPVDRFARAIDGAKNAFLTPEQFASKAAGFQGKLEADVYSHYQQALFKANAMDFGDLLFNAVVVLQKFPEVLGFYRHLLHYILVDEFQDTNEVQYTFIRLLSEPRQNLLVVGDDDQSIYAFRGATIRNILEFERDFPTAKVVKLEQNYRSTGNILEVANEIITKNSKRKPKRLWTDSAPGPQVQTYIADDEGDESNFIAQQIKSYLSSGGKPKDIAIFYRTNAQSRALEEALSLGGIPYRIFGGLKFYDRKEIKDILSYLRILMNEPDTQSFLRVVNTPPRGVGPQTVQTIVEQAKASGSTLIAAARIVAQRSKGVADFINLFDQLRELLKTKAPSALIDFIVEKTGYAKRLAEGNDPAAETRMENIQELKAIATFMEFEAASPAEALKTMLDRIALTAGADLPAQQPSQGVDPAKQEKDAVSLMTLHLAKGLEYPVVFLTGLEEGLIPHQRSLDDPTGLEEERRLCYVGVTRAMQTLYITRAIMRGMFAAGGGSGFRVVSRFAYDMPEHCLNHLNGPFTAGEFGGGGFVDSELESWEQGEGRQNRYSPAKTSSQTGGGQRWWSEQNEPKGSAGKQLLQKKLSAASKLAAVRPADSFAGSNAKKEAAPLLPVGPIAKPEELQPGIQVKHPAFGLGAVSAREEDHTGDPAKLKIIVKFDSSEEPKKFIYKFAKISLA